VRRSLVRRKGRLSGSVWIGAALALYAGLVQPACSGSARDFAPPTEESCYRNSDCKYPYLCALGRCRTACNTARDCEKGGSCISDGTIAVCQSAADKNSPCDRPADCAAPLACASDYRCRNLCRGDSDCNLFGISGRVCATDANGVDYCAEPSEVGPTGKLDVDPAPGNSGKPVLEPVVNDGDGGSAGEGGAPAQAGQTSDGGTNEGGKASAGMSFGGKASAGMSAGGANAGGTHAGGSNAGGTNTGGTNAGGMSTGGKASGGTSAGGAAGSSGTAGKGGAGAGGAGTGGAGTGGAGTGGAGTGGTGTLSSPPWTAVPVQDSTDPANPKMLPCNVVTKADGAGQGPFFIHDLEHSDDISLFRQDVRGQYQSAAEPGVDMELYVRLIDKTKSDASCQAIVPLSDFEVYIYHTDAQGYFSGFGRRGTANEQKPDVPYNGSPGTNNLENTDRFCRGAQVTDANGVAAFLSVFPGWFNGRALNIQLLVFKKGSLSRGRVTYSKSVEPNWIFTTELYFDEAFSKSVHESVEPYKRRTLLTAYTSAIKAIESGNSGVHATATKVGNKVIAQVQIVVDPT